MNVIYSLKLFKNHFEMFVMQETCLLCKDLGIIITTLSSLLYFTLDNFLVTMLFFFRNNL